MAKKRLFGLPFAEAVATLVGTTIGAGIFGIPYVVAKAGFLAGVINLIVLGAVILLINLYTGEIALRTEKIHMLAGYAGLYLGKLGKTLMALTAIFGIYGALIAYLIGEGQVLSAIFGGPPLYFSLGFFVVMFILIFFDLGVIKKAELILSSIMLLLVLTICGFSLPQISLANLSDLGLSKIFLPYGVILFAFLGAAAVPEMEEELRKNKAQLKKAIIIGSLIPFAVYLLFMTAVVGVTGLGTTEVATVGLGRALGQHMVLFGNLFPVFSMATTFLILGLALKWMFHYDYGIPKILAWLLTCLVPLALFLGGARSFIDVIAITGAVSGGIECVLLVLTARAAKAKGQVRPAYSIPINWPLLILLIALFAAGIASQLLPGLFE